MNYRSLWWILPKTFSAWSDQETPRLGAALAVINLLEQDRKV
jgi:hypothetical protein